MKLGLTIIVITTSSHNILNLLSTVRLVPKIGTAEPYAIYNFIWKMSLLCIFNTHYRITGNKSIRLVFYDRNFIYKNVT